MSHITPLKREDLPEFEAMFKQRDAMSGFVANSVLIMGHRPEILSAYQNLLHSIYFQGKVDHSLKVLIAMMRSSAAGCRYCWAHTANHGANDQGIEAEKLESLWEFETNPIFTDAERAALRLARDAAQLPNAATAAHFDSLRAYFTDAQIVEIVGVISLFAFLNSWNDTLATPLEEIPVSFASEHLQPVGWSVGKHVGPASEMAKS